VQYLYRKNWLIIYYGTFPDIIQFLIEIDDDINRSQKSKEQITLIILLQKFRNRWKIGRRWTVVSQRRHLYLVAHIC